MSYEITDYVAALYKLVHACEDSIDDYSAIELACKEAKELLKNDFRTDPKVYRDILKTAMNLLVRNGI